MKEVPTINPKILGKRNPKLIRRLEETLDKIASSEVRPLFEEIELKQRRVLDEIVFCHILGLTREEMNDICKATGSLFKARIERLSGK